MNAPRARLFSDYHSHPQGHRLQRYTPELLQPWIDSARAKGLTDIAFTDHDRYHAGIDFDVIARVRDANPDIRIRAGIELDNDPVHSPASRRWIEQHWEQLDFVLGSVHFLDRADRMFDSVPAGAEQFAGREVDSIYEDYFRRVRDIAATGLVDCLAHIDLIKIHGHRPKTDVRELARETFELISARGLATELSTAGWRKPVDEMYPSNQLIELAIELEIPFTTASDAHSHPQLAADYERLGEKLRRCGVAQICTFSRHQRQLHDV